MSIKKKSLNYQDAGVNIDAGVEFVELIKKAAGKTYNPNVLSGIGGFGALYKLNNKYKNPVLVSAADGVGTKIHLANRYNKNRWIGIDLVAMCVNDILTMGAEPLFFLDYLAVGKLHNRYTEIIQGITDGCSLARIALIGGETSEHPGVMKANHYDLAGFCIGITEKNKIIPNTDLISPGMKIIGLSSAGIHSNGFSLIRKIVSNEKKKGNTIKDDLIHRFLLPSNIYASIVQSVLRNFKVYGMAHITGGGFYKNIPRILPKNLGACISLNSWKPPDLFNIIARLGPVEIEEMFSVYNMGIGFIMIVDSAAANNLIYFINDEAKKYQKEIEHIFTQDVSKGNSLKPDIIEAYDIGEIIELDKINNDISQNNPLNKKNNQMIFLV